MINSAEYHWIAWRDVMQNEGQPITYETFAKTFGQRNDTILKMYFGDDVSPSTMKRIANDKEERYRELVRTSGIQLLPGVQYWLNYIQAHGWKQAIASAAPRKNIETVLEVLHIGAYFDIIISSEDVERGKPDPQVFLKAAQRLGVPANQCIVIEDAHAGIEGANRAGMRAIGVRTNHPDLQADEVVDNLEQLPSNIFEQLLSIAT